jgi:putative spermidine/putrescine transport system ATP-binding protein
VTTRVFVGNQWLLAVETSLGKLHVAQPNHGAPPPEEGHEVGLAWTDDDLRVLTREGTHGNA